MRVFVSRMVFPLFGLLLASSVQAGTATGQITANLTLTTACQVNGADAGGGGVDFGSLSFGTVNSLFAETDGQVLGGGGGALSILCSSGTSPKVQVSAGSNDGQSAGGTRSLSDGMGNFVPYDLYTDPGHTMLLPIDDVIDVGVSTGMAQVVNIYGKAVGKPGLPAGTYSDTIAVTLTF